MILKDECKKCQCIYCVSHNQGQGCLVLSKLGNEDNPEQSSCKKAICPINGCKFYVYDNANHLNWAKIYPEIYSE